MGNILWDAQAALPSTTGGDSVSARGTGCFNAARSWFWPSGHCLPLSTGATCSIPGEEEMTNYTACQNTQQQPLIVVTVMFVYPALYPISQVAAVRAPPRPPSGGPAQAWICTSGQPLYRQCGGVLSWLSQYSSHAGLRATLSTPGLA